MSPYKTLLSLAVVLVMTAFLPQHVYAQNWINGQPAIFEIGQTGFDLNPQYQTLTGADAFYQPEFVVVDPATGKVFVTDTYNGRVLRFPSSAAMQNGASAEAVLGQVNFFGQGNGQPPTAATLVYPAGLAIDAAGNLWVADGSDMRVLRFANAATIASGTAASEVLGQPDFVSYLPSQTGPPTAASMFFPCGVFCSGTTLWVADEQDERILRFDNAASKANGAPADAVFGVPNFVYWAGVYPLPTAANSLNFPNQIYVDAADNLWVADVLDNRVLMFPNASFAVTAANGGIGGPATLVLGQTNFTDNSPGTTASTMDYPDGVYMDGAGNLYVSEYLNNRILVFQNAAGLLNGAAATYVLGQPDFVSNGSGDGASQLTNPYSLFVSAGTPTVLMAADVNNYRVMIFTPPTLLPLTLTSFTGQLQPNGQALLQWQVSNQDGPAGATMELQYSTTDTSGFTNVLSTQPVKPVISGYRYIQVSPAVGANYYRVRLTAPDGSATYSQVVTINVGSGAAGAGLSIYPNPASSTVVVALPSIGPAVVEVYNSAGGLMQRLSTTSTVNTLNVAGWAAGLYTVRVTQGGASMSGSFVKN